MPPSDAPCRGGLEGHQPEDEVGDTDSELHGCLPVRSPAVPTQEDPGSPGHTQDTNPSHCAGDTLLADPGEQDSHGTWQTVRGRS